MRRVLYAIGVVGLFGALSPSALGAVTVGQTFTPVRDFGGPGTFIQSSSPDNSYTIPANGVISSWSFEAAAGTTAPLKLKVVRSAGGADFTTVGDSQLETPTPSSLNTWPTRISVRAGDFLGHSYTALDSTTSFRDAPGFNTQELCCSDPVLDPPPGTTATYEPDVDLQIDVSAILEPDADQDGFGDETQDQCPTNAATHGPCPVTPAKKKCKKHKKRHSAESAKKKCKKKHH